jgi:aconitase B
MMSPRSRASCRNAGASRGARSSMGLTLSEKILAAHAGVARVRPGEIVTCRVDLAVGTDVTVPLALQALSRMGARRRSVSGDLGFGEGVAL